MNIKTQAKIMQQVGELEEVCKTNELSFVLAIGQNGEAMRLRRSEMSGEQGKRVKEPNFFMGIKALEGDDKTLLNILMAKGGAGVMSFFLQNYVANFLAVTFLEKVGLKMVHGLSGMAIDMDSYHASPVRESADELMTRHWDATVNECNEAMALLATALEKENSKLNVPVLTVYIQATVHSMLSAFLENTNKNIDQREESLAELVNGLGFDFDL